MPKHTPADQKARLREQAVKALEKADTRLVKARERATTLAEKASLAESRAKDAYIAVHTAETERNLLTEQIRWIDTMPVPDAVPDTAFGDGVSEDLDAEPALA